MNNLNVDESILSTATAAMIEKDKPNIALVPIGAYEQHGPHLPMTTDTIIACAIAHGLAERHRALRVSPITISCSHEHSGFTGCIALSAATLGRVIGDIVEWVARNEIGLTVLVNGHGGNYVLGNIAQEANVDEPRVLVGPTRKHWNIARRNGEIETRDEHDMHAGEIETSLLLHVWRSAVRVDLIADTPGDEPRVTTFYGVKHYNSPRRDRGTVESDTGKRQDCSGNARRGNGQRNRERARAPERVNTMDAQAKDAARRWLAVCDVIRMRIKDGTLPPASAVNHETAAPEADPSDFNRAATLLADWGILIRTNGATFAVGEPRARIVHGG